MIKRTIVDDLFRSNKKQKKTQPKKEETDNEDLKEKLKEYLLTQLEEEGEEDGKEHHLDMFETKHEDIYMVKNHVYFRAKVNDKNISKLIKTLNEYKEEIRMLKNENNFLTIETKPIYLHITSMGGTVHDGFIAYDYIKNSKIPIYTICEGFCASMATVITMASSKRYMTPNAYMLIHQIRGAMFGKYSEVEDEYKHWRSLMTKIVKIYSDVSGKKLTKQKIRDLMKKEKSLDAQTCLKYGFVNELYYGDDE
uniref:Protease n=1 Tax=viral metagenome TaxID=1070528 RepID=A0A6C0ECH6_9ZZZZ